MQKCSVTQFSQRVHEGRPKARGTGWTQPCRDPKNGLSGHDGNVVTSGSILVRQRGRGRHLVDDPALVVGVGGVVAVGDPAFSVVADQLGNVGVNQLVVGHPVAVNPDKDLAPVCEGTIIPTATTIASDEETGNDSAPSSRRSQQKQENKPADAPNVRIPILRPVAPT